MLRRTWFLEKGQTYEDRPWRKNVPCGRLGSKKLELLVNECLTL
jgi:hypothetical protein